MAFCIDFEAFAMAWLPGQAGPFFPGGVGGKSLALAGARGTGTSEAPGGAPRIGALTLCLRASCQPKLGLLSAR